MSHMQFVHRASYHNTDTFVKSTLREELSWLERNKVSVYDWTVTELAIGRVVGDLLGVGAHDDLRGQSAELCERRGVRQP
jgi:hypothetical protein